VERDHHPTEATKKEQQDSARDEPGRLKVVLRKVYRTFIPSQSEREYAEPKRLADVMALIQVLALGETTHPTEDQLKNDLLKDLPRSGVKRWRDVAQAHPEFFRVNPGQKNEKEVALIARHMMPKKNEPGGGRESLTLDHVDSLLRSAVEMHDRQVRRSERWTYLVPIWVALVAGIFSIFVVILRGLLGAP
jgi:hypothetical protein